MLMSDVFVIAGARTPMGAFQGELSSLSAPQLGAAAIAAAMERSEIPASEIGETVMGCVLPAGMGQAPARQAARQAGIPDAVPATTVSKVCGSGMKAIMVAADGLALGRGSFAVAGGMESMSNAPYLLPKARGGYRLGHGEIKDHMFLDGLEDASEHRLMGTYAEDAARHFQFTRQDQDAYATESLVRAKRALAEGDFEAEITPVTPAGRSPVAHDEPPRKADPAKIPLLRPAFAPDGTVTAANSSSISDGAAALILANTDGLRSQSIKPVARIVAHASFALEPRWFTTAPVGAVRKVLELAGWSVEDVDLFEVNEAFAAVAMIAMRELDLPHERLNVNGGACALGHPIGCSGARIVVTLLHALAKRGLKKGVASLCIGGGEATALALEMVS
ncbi:acetyl-CoA C-acyltransferase [Rhizomicrobium electricum]|uniref:Acetyl-CoA C-acyltransferase n=2 Tax=Rhizomicrobium electricum TaxID=480070 RepID=A0ABP3NZU7_9PROT